MMRQRCRGLRGPELDLFFKVYIETVFACDAKKRLSHKYNPSLPSQVSQFDWVGIRISHHSGLAGFVIAIVLGIYYNWKLGSVAAAFLPLMIGAAFLHMKIIMGVDSVEKKALERSSKLAVEAISNIRTVASSRSEESFLMMYLSELREPHRMTLNKANIRGFIFGFSQAIQFFSWAACVFCGGYLVEAEEMNFHQVFKVACTTITGAGMIGYSFAFTADFQKAITAASNMIQILERKSKINADPSAGLQLTDSMGNISLSDAVFSYPTRPDNCVLNKLVLSIQAGEKVALVGQSGCGKSTVIQLIQRLYDLDEGTMTADHQDITALNLPGLRSKIGLVSQEPVLFDRTIAENIAYGDNSREVDIEEVTVSKCYLLLSSRWLYLLLLVRCCDLLAGYGSR